MASPTAVKPSAMEGCATCQSDEVKWELVDQEATWELAKHVVELHTDLAVSDDMVLDLRRLLLEGALDLPDDRAYEDWQAKVAAYVKAHPVVQIEARVVARHRALAHLHSSAGHDAAVVQPGRTTPKGADPKGSATSPPEAEQLGRIGGSNPSGGVPAEEQKCEACARTASRCVGEAPRDGESLAQMGDRIYREEHREMVTP